MESYPEIDNKYIIIEKLSSGFTGKVYKVKDKNSNKIYAAKVFIRPNYYEKEINMLKIIKDIENPYVINMIGDGEGEIIYNGRSQIKKYIILDFAEKRNLNDYIKYPNKGFGEKYAKFIFRKILEGVSAIHEKGICHRDLKPANILLDIQFNPKIADFGFASLIKGKDGNGNLRSNLGTESYTAPEIRKNGGYNGIQADIFSLGQILFILVAGKTGFEKADGFDNRYKHIKAENYREYKKYWKKTFKEFPGIKFSEEFQKLFINMVHINPKKRISIEEILEKDPWLEEIRILNEEELKNKINNDFLEREKIVLKNVSETLSSSFSEDTDVGNGNENENENVNEIKGDNEYISKNFNLK